MIEKLNDSPVLLANDLKDALEVALKYETLEGALTYMCIWDTERIVKQATSNFGSGANGAGWDTCFGYLIKLTTKEYLERHKKVIISIRG